MSDYPNARDCKHGRLRRSCDSCELEQEIAERDARIRELEDEVRGWTVAYTAVRGSADGADCDLGRKLDDALAALAVSEARVRETEIVVNDLTAQLDKTDDPQIVEDMREKIAELEARCAAYVTALLFYASPPNWSPVDGPDSEEPPIMLIARGPHYSRLDGQGWAEAWWALQAAHHAPWMRLVEAVREYGAADAAMEAAFGGGNAPAEEVRAHARCAKARKELLAAIRACELGEGR